MQNFEEVKQGKEYLKICSIQLISTSHILIEGHVTWLLLSATLSIYGDCCGWILRLCADWGSDIVKKCPVRILVRRGCKVRYCDIGHTMDIDHATLRALKRISCEKKEEKEKKEKEIKKILITQHWERWNGFPEKKKKPLGKFWLFRVIISQTLFPFKAFTINSLSFIFSNRPLTGDALQRLTYRICPLGFSLSWRGQTTFFGQFYSSVC